MWWTASFPTWENLQGRETYVSQQKCSARKNRCYFWEPLVPVWHADFGRSEIEKQGVLPMCGCCRILWGDLPLQRFNMRELFCGYFGGWAAATATEVMPRWYVSLHLTLTPGLRLRMFATMGARSSQHLRSSMRRRLLRTWCCAMTFAT